MVKKRSYEVVRKESLKGIFALDFPDFYVHGVKEFQDRYEVLLLPEEDFDYTKGPFMITVSVDKTTREISYNI